MFDIHEDVQNNNWRFERKFLISQMSEPEIEAVVKSHPAMFSEIYHERHVNNIYFDSLDILEPQA